MKFLQRLFLISLFFSSPAITRANLLFEFLWGHNFNLPFAMTEYGLGAPVIHYPQWESRSFTIFQDAPYWATRIEVWNNKHTWAIGENGYIKKFIWLIQTAIYSIWIFLMDII